MDYNNLRKSFIIFICGYDSFGKDQYIYTFENVCREVPGLVFGDETYKVVINTKGHLGDVSDELKEIIAYLDHGAVTGAYSREIDDAVKAVKASEEWRMEYMMQFVRDNEMRAEGRAEGEAKLTRINKLISRLLQDKQYDLIEKITENAVFRDEMLQRYGL